MTKHIVSVEKNCNNFRINIPASVVKAKGWKNERYVILNDWPENAIIIERIMNETFQAKRNRKRRIK